MSASWHIKFSAVSQLAEQLFLCAKENREVSNITRRKSETNTVSYGRAKF